MGLFGTLVTGALGGFPKKPDLPSAAYVNPGESQQQAIDANAGALPGLMDLGSDVNAYNLSERAKALTAGIPGYDAISKKGSDVLLSQLNGVIPDDVASAIGRRSNARAFAGGYGGSEAARNLESRDLGLTSLDLIQRGQAAAPGWLTSLYNLGVPQQFNVQSGFLSPTDVISTNQWNETNRFNTQWAQNQLDALPDPETAAIAKDVGQLTDLVATAALAWAGGGIGGMIGGAGGASMGGALGGQAGGAAGGFDIGSIIGSLMGGGGGQQQTLPNYAPYGGGIGSAIGGR